MVCEHIKISVVVFSPEYATYRSASDKRPTNDSKFASGDDQAQDLTRAMDTYSGTRVTGCTKTYPLLPGRPSLSLKLGPLAGTGVTGCRKIYFAAWQANSQFKVGTSSWYWSHRPEKDIPFAAWKANSRFTVGTSR